MQFASAEGLKIEAATDRANNRAAWPTWQARVGVVTTPDIDLGSGSSSARGAALLGDYYFTGSGFDAKRVGGGLRATTGWLYGGGSALDAGAGISASSFVSSTWLRNAASDDARVRHAGYIGIGYTGLLFRSGFGFSADLGLVGTAANGTARLDSDVKLGDFRLAPAVRLGVSYAF